MRSTCTRALAAAVVLAASVPFCRAEPIKVYMIGNSLTDEVKYDTRVKLCKEAGEGNGIGRQPN